MIKGVEVVSHHPFKGGNGHPHLRWRCQFPISSEVEVAIPISSEECEGGHLISYKGGGSGHPPSLQRWKWSPSPLLRWRSQFPISFEVEVAIPLSSEEGEDGHPISYKVNGHINFHPFKGGNGHPCLY